MMQPANKFLSLSPCVFVLKHISRCPPSAFCAATTNYPRFSYLQRTEIYFLIVMQAWKSKIKVQAGSVVW